jgi:hypothetical protein
MLLCRLSKPGAFFALGVLCLLFLQVPAGAGGQAHTHVVSDVPAAFTPHLKADTVVSHPLAFAVAQSGNIIYVGGKFQSVQSANRMTSYARSNLFAFNATTGTVLNYFVPKVNHSIYAIVTVGDSVYIAGAFNDIGGFKRRGVAKLNRLTGAVDLKFNARFTTGKVSDMHYSNGRLIVGGTFPKRLAALDPATGADTGYINISIAGQLPLTTTPTEVYRFAINPAGNRLVGVGNFTTVDGASRRRAFMLNLGTNNATLHPWYYPPLNNKCLSNTAAQQAYLTDVDFSPDGRYFVFVSTGRIPATTAEIGTAICDAAARFETNIANPSAPTWINYTGGDTIQSVIATGAAVYVQGHFRWLDNPFGRDTKGPGAVDRLGIGAINPRTGKALAWNPSAPAAQGGRDFLATPSGLWAVSDGQRFGGEFHHGIAFCPLPAIAQQSQASKR